MARYILVKPEFCSDPQLTRCSISARLLFIAVLLPQAHGNGRLPRDLTLRPWCHDYTEANLQTCYEQLHQAGILARDAHGWRVLEVAKWRA